MSDHAYLRWLAAATPTKWWHDSANIDELDVALANGAVGVTTNPFLVNGTLRDRAAYWQQQGVSTAGLPEGDERAEALIRQVTDAVLDRVRPLRELGFGCGYCCGQLNPNKPGGYDVMLEQAGRYAEWADNLVIKIPATRAGIAVFEEMAARGCNVAATVSFTVPQVLAVGEAFRRGAARARARGIEPGLGIAVVMVGRLDDYLRDVSQDSTSPAGEADIIWAGTAAIKRAYAIFQERGYECVLMPAGCRGAYHILELAGAQMICSIAPKIAGMLAAEKPPFSERIDRAVDPAILRRLQSMPEFVKAYEPDGMTQDAFITFGSTNRTLTQFCDNGWNPLQTLTFGKPPADQEAGRP
jgi:transaldolase